MPHRNAHRSLSTVVGGPSVRVAQELVGLAERGELCRGRLRVVRPNVRVQAVYCPAIGTRQLAPGGVRLNPQDLVRIVHGHRWPRLRSLVRHSTWVAEFGPNAAAQLIPFLKLVGRSLRCHGGAVAGQLGDLLDVARHREFVGRTSQLACFDAALAGRA